ncbi:MAG: peptidoglycan-associated lipoprotein Pal [Desulfobacterales bacterium]
MQKKWWMVLALLLVMPGLLFTVACQKKVAATAAPAPAPAPPPKVAAPAPAPAPAAAPAVPVFMTERIFFDFDKSALKLEAQAALKKKAEWLKANPSAKLLIEGNCDERGTNEYNMALGERRAQSAKKFLVDLGIDTKRISTISYGEERPIDPGRNEAAWAKNRNDGFVVSF